MLRLEDAPDLLTVEQVAELFQRTPRTIDRWCNQGVFQPIHLGRTKRIAREDVLKLISERAARATDGDSGLE